MAFWVQAFSFGGAFRLSATQGSRPNPDMFRDLHHEGVPTQLDFIFFSELIESRLRTAETLRSTGNLVPHLPNYPRFTEPFFQGSAEEVGIDIAVYRFAKGKFGSAAI